jgi:hypothetical protein
MKVTPYKMFMPRVREETGIITLATIYIKSRHSGKNRNPEYIEMDAGSGPA